MKIGWCKCLQEIVLIYYCVVPSFPMQMCNEGGERKRPAPADGDENIDPEDEPPKAKQP